MTGIRKIDFLLKGRTPGHRRKGKEIRGKGGDKRINVCNMNAPMPHDESDHYVL